MTIATGTAPYRDHGLLNAGMTVRISPAGGRVFDAGTFLFGAALGGKIDLGVSAASFDRFARNVMEWLGVAAPRPDTGKPAPTLPPRRVTGHTGA